VIDMSPRCLNLISIRNIKLNVKKGEKFIKINWKYHMSC